MISKIDKNSVRKARHYRTRRYIIGTEARPRLNVYRSLQHIYAQIIDDKNGVTLCASSTLDAEVKAHAGRTAGGEERQRNTGGGDQIDNNRNIQNYLQRHMRHDTGHHQGTIQIRRILRDKKQTI